ncbi:MAG: hypothetical protein AAF998_29140, partial [Bacteroidota bacterium]
MPAGLLMAQPDFTNTEAIVNTTTANSQQHPATAIDSAGNFVVVWESFAEDGDDFGIYAQRFSAGGSANGSPFLVNSTTADAQSFPDVAMDASGNFIIVWMSENQDLDGWGVYAQRYNSSGATVGSNFQVATTSTGNQRQPKVAMNASGQHVITWMDENLDASSYGIYFALYSAANAVVVGETAVNTTTNDYQGYPDVGMAADGSFAIVWQSKDQDGSGNGIYGQLFTAAGATSGSEFLVNTVTANNQQEPAIGVASDGKFVVAWSDFQSGTSLYEIEAQRFSATGAALNSAFTVNTTNTGSNDHARIAMTQEGVFLVVWEGYQDGSYTGVYAQAYDSTGAASGSESLVNDRTTDFQQAGAPAAWSKDSTWVVAWQDGFLNSTSTNDGSDYGVYFKTVPVQGNTPPTAICQNITVYLNSSGSVTIAAADVDGGSTDAEGAVTLSATPTSFNCLNLGTNVVTLTVTDAGGLTAQCFPSVTVVDSSAPNVVCNNLFVYLDGSGTASITAADLDGGSSDNCSISSFAASQTSYNCANSGTNAVTLTATDGSGNSASCSANVTVIDSISPTAVCQNLNIYLDNSGSATITGADLDGGSTDNCGISGYVASQSSFNCANIGANAVTLTVSDASGNSGSCSATVTVIDSVTPTAICNNIGAVKAALTGDITR